MIDELLERVRHLLDSKRNAEWAVDLRQTREEIAAEQEKAEALMEQLDDADLELAIAANEAEGEHL